jgi:MtN3 and saliva related transmembrane protein
MNWSEYIGHIASAMSGLAFLPQVFSTWKTKSVNDLNLLTILTVFSSTIFWLIYGIDNVLYPVILCNATIFILSLTLIVFKLKYSKNKKPFDSRTV